MNRLNRPILTTLAATCLLALTACGGELADDPQGGERDEMFNRPAAGATKLAPLPAVPLPTCPVGTDMTITIKKSCIFPFADQHYYRLRFKIRQSNIVIDCNGSTLHGLSKGQKVRPPLTVNNAYEATYPAGQQPEWEAFMVEASESSETDLAKLKAGAVHNVVIRNCKIQDYLYGAKMRYKLDQTTKNTLKAAKNITGSWIEAIEDRLRAGAPRQITLRDVDIRGSHATGVYVHSYVHQVTFDRGSIHHSGSMAIYLDSGTRNNTVSRSSFQGNGRFKWDNDRRVRTYRGGKAKREAIAVDASAYNTFRANTFGGNAAGGIFLYKNCYEKASEAREIPRFQHSRNNRIEDNTFTKEKVGLWIASRQSRDLRSWGCGDPVVYQEGWLIKRKYYRDYAENTRVSGNLFDDNDTGVRVEDDNALVKYNTFRGNNGAGIAIGSWIKYKTGKPVKDTRVERNLFLTPSSRAIVHNYGSRGTRFIMNRAAKGGSSVKYYGPCALPFYTPAFNAPGKTCRMERVAGFESHGDKLLLSLTWAHNKTYTIRDTTNEGYSKGVWGKGKFLCLNGQWLRKSGYCCYGPSCS